MNLYILFSWVIKMLKKQYVFKIVLFIVILVLSGCGQNENANNQEGISAAETANHRMNVESGTKFTEAEKKAEDILYHSEDGIDLLRALHRCVSDGENIYLVYGEPDLYIMPIGTGEHRPANVNNPEKMDVCNIALDAHGRIHLLVAGQDNEKWLIWRLDENYQVDREIDISAYFETKYMPLWFLVDADGTYYLQWVIDRNGIIIDNEGALRNRFTPESLEIEWIYEATVGKDGLIYIVYSHSDEKLEIGKFNVEKCLIENETLALSFPGDEIFNAMAGGTDTNLLLFSPYSGGWAYDKESGIENLVPLSEIGFGSNTEFYPLTFLPDGRLVLLAGMADGNYMDDESSKDWLLRYIPIGK